MGGFDARGELEAAGTGALTAACDGADCVTGTGCDGASWVPTGCSGAAGCVVGAGEDAEEGAAGAPVVALVVGGADVAVGGGAGAGAPGEGRGGRYASGST